MDLKGLIIAAAGFLVLISSGCSAPAPLWYAKSGKMLESLRSEGAPFMLPAEFASLVETYSKGELLLGERQVEDADRIFHLAFLKGEMLKESISAEKRRQAEAKRRQLEEEEFREKARLEAIAREEKRRRKEADELLAKIAQQAKIASDSEATHISSYTQKTKKGVALVVNHTVKRGETLPQIAALPEVYNNQLLWPVIYRANRDQIRDPRHLWPGQVLRIPRNLTRDDLNEARRYAQEKRLF